MPLFFFDQKSQKDKFDLDKTVAMLLCFPCKYISIIRCEKRLA